MLQLFPSAYSLFFHSFPLTIFTHSFIHSLARSRADARTHSSSAFLFFFLVSYNVLEYLVLLWMTKTFHEVRQNLLEWAPERKQTYDSLFYICERATWTSSSNQFCIDARTGRCGSHVNSRQRAQETSGKVSPTASFKNVRLCKLCPGSHPRPVFP